MFRRLIKNRKQVYYILIELILIIVGVLCAIAVENSRQEARERTTELNYLRSIKASVEADTSMLKREIQKCFQKQKAGKTFLELISTGKVVDPTEFEALTQSVLMGIDPFYSTAIFEDIRASGNLQIIINDELRTQIINYYLTVAHLSQIQSQQRDDLSYNRTMLDVLTFDEFTFEALDQKDLIARMRQDKEVVEYLGRLEKTAYTQHASLLFTCLPKSLDLLDAINTELERRE